jgi:hypothetical protein
LLPEITETVSSVLGNVILVRRRPPLEMIAWLRHWGINRLFNVSTRNALVIFRVNDAGFDSSCIALTLDNVSEVTSLNVRF